MFARSKVIRKNLYQIRKQSMMHSLQATEKTRKQLEAKVPAHPEVRSVIHNLCLYLSRHAQNSHPKLAILDRKKGVFETRVHQLRRLFLNDVQKLAELDEQRITDIEIGASREYDGLSLCIVLSDNRNEDETRGTYTPVKESDYIPFDVHPDLSALADKNDRDKALRVVRLVCNMYTRMPLISMEISHQTESEYELTFYNTPTVSKAFVDYFMSRFDHIVNNVCFSRDAKTTPQDRGLMLSITLNKTNAQKRTAYSAKRPIANVASSEYNNEKRAKQ